MLEILRRHYDTIYLWIQTLTDYQYARSLDADLRFTSHSLRALDELLTSNIDLDYIGVRLHAGIRAIQQGRRSVILEIDNRAREMGRNFGLPTVERTDNDRRFQATRRPGHHWPGKVLLSFRLRRPVA